MLKFNIKENRECVGKYLVKSESDGEMYSSCYFLSKDKINYCEGDLYSRPTYCPLTTDRTINLKFDLETHEDEEEFVRMMNYSKFNSAIYDFDQWLRGEIKWREMPDDHHDIYQLIRDKLHEFVNESNTQIG